jgi:2'-5' RNA ligase
VYSLNVPVPGEVGRLAGEVARDLPTARARPRGEHTLVAKRLGTGDRGEFQRVATRVREALAGTPAFEARVAAVDYFETAADGASPVVYLAVESPELQRLHERLCSVVDPVDGIEGEAYVPHVTVARGGRVDAAERLTGRDIDPVTWTVTELQFWDAERSLSAGSVSLPA